MTRTHLDEITSGHAPMTDAGLDDVLATARKVILAAPNTPAALARLYAFIDAELVTLANHRGVYRNPDHLAGRHETGDRQTALLQHLGL